MGFSHSFFNCCCQCLNDSYTFNMIYNKLSLALRNVNVMYLYGMAFFRVLKCLPAQISIHTLVAESRTLQHVDCRVQGLNYPSTHGSTDHVINYTNNIGVNVEILT